MRVTARIYKASFVSGLILVAPLLIGTLWYVGKAYLYVSRYERALGPSGAKSKSSVDLELFQIALHDALVRDLLRLKQPDRDPKRSLPTLSISLTRESLDALARENEPDESEPATYAKGLLEKDGKVHEIKVRYRGEQPWHLLGAQRSMKIRLERGDLLDGVRVFNLWNDPTPFGLEDQIILDLARGADLLAPEYRPVWVRINNLDMGVYRFEAQPDETLLRQGHRIPGNMYSGDSSLVESGVGALFSDPAAWQKIASRSEDATADRTDLLRLLDRIRSASFDEFATHARRAIDLEKYARFDALDVVFGGSEHDYFSNHKLYFDPYRGKVEPVAFSFRGFQHEPTFNVIDHPLLIRLKQTPGYLAARDRAVYSLLTGPASVSAIRARADEAIRELGGDLRADPNWDAYKLLPRASRLHRFLIRPMTLDRWGLASAKEIDEFSKRSRFLLDELEGSGMTVERAPFEPADTRPGAEPAWVSAVRVTVDGHSAKLLGGIKMRRACAAEVAVFADANLDGALGPVDVELVRSTQSQVELDRYNVLTPRPVLMAHPDPSEKRGRVRVGTEPTSFVYFVVSRECVPEEITLEVADLVTGGSRLHVAHVSGTLGPTEHLDEVPVTSVPQVLVGGRSPHPWAFEQPESPRRVILGPGSVDVPESRDYSDRVTVEIRPGTTLRLGPKVSLRFRGPLLAEGSRDQPIVIEKAADAPFGGVSLEGPGTEGSRLSWVRMEGGTKVEAPDVELTALFNAHDTSDLRISDSTFLSAGPAEDVVHLYKVSKLSFHEVSLSAAPVDALDLEFVEGELRGLSVQGAGDDCVDLMGSRLTLSDSVLVACVNNGVSAGEETDLFANGLAVVGAKTGILAKNASTVRLIRSLVFDTKQALRTRAHEVRYGGTSRIGATEVFVLRAEAAADVDGSGSIELSGVEVGAPEGPDLRHIITDVLELEDGRDLTTSLLELEQKVRP